MFETLVGQNLVKKKLQFYKESYDTSKRMPFLFFVGAKGLGKTEFAKQLAKEIKNTDGSRRPFLEINCSTLKRVDDFFEQIFLPLIYNNEVTVLFDEAHELPKGLTNAFLTIFNTDQDHIKDFNLNDQVFTFDFTKQSFFFATTESDKVFAPLKDRLITVDFEPYTKKELSEYQRSPEAMRGMQSNILDSTLYLIARKIAFNTLTKQIFSSSKMKSASTI
jgi:Holliday junction resolvasome RuvABC ATP-dependent DNA helicase subunit